MTNPLGQFEKPEAEPYQRQRKLFLVPNFPIMPGVYEELDPLLDKYWSEVRDHLNNLERSLGPVSHVYHEMVFEEGDDGLSFVEQMNPKGHSFIQALCQSTAKMEMTEDRALVEESSDWQRCLSIGLASEKVSKLAVDSYREATQKRWEHIAARIDETLVDQEAGALFIREDHSVQFPEGVQVFYVAPPALNALKQWLDEQMRAMREAPAPEPE